MTSLAIVGLSCAYGSGACDADRDLDAYARNLYQGTSASYGNAEPDNAALEKVVRKLLAGVTAKIHIDSTDVPIGSSNVRLGTLVCTALAAEAKAQSIAQVAADALGIRAVGDAPPLSAGLETGDLALALHSAQQWLSAETSNQVDLVLIAAEESLGTGAILLAREDRVRVGTIYARIDYAAEGATPELDRPGDIGYLETGMWPPAPEVVSMCAQSEPDLTCAVGSLAPESDRVSPVASLIKVALAIHRRTLYPSPDPNGVGTIKGWESTPFYVVPRARPWFTSGSQIRQAAIVYRRGAGWVQLRLAEAGPDRRDVRLRRQLYARECCYLLPVAGTGPEALLVRLEGLRQELTRDTDPAAIARAAAAAYAAEPDAAYAVALVGHDRDELLKEIAYAVDGVRRAFEPGSRRKDWQTPKGSALTADPLGNGSIAFVYPGAFNAYVGLAQDLFQHFPGLHASYAHLTNDLGQRLAERFLYPRSRTWAEAANTAIWEARLRDNSVALIESGAMAAVGHTLVLRRLFGVEAHMAFGYSLGEISMLWAGGVWQEGDKGSASFSSSSLFRNRVVGSKLAIREHWGLAPDEPMIWATYLLKARVEAVQEAVAREPRVYLTLINLPDEVVIGGEAAACRRVVAALSCHALEVPYDIAIHNDAIASEYENLVALYSQEVFARPDVRFYSAAGYEPLALEQDALAEAIAKMSCNRVDFPRLVRRVYDDGARIFVELGPLATCTRRIKRILKGVPHTAVAMNPSPGSDFEGVLGVLALLIAHRVPVDLDALYQSEAESVADDISCELVLWPQTTAGPALNDGGRQLEPATATPGYLPRIEDKQMHRAFLDARSAAQDGAGDVIGLQVAASDQLLAMQPGSSGSMAPARNGVAFIEDDVRTFATGDVALCFGSDYEVYRGRRVPRIPNGDLQFITRVMTIEGEPGVFQDEPALWSEFDVPARGWFDQGGVGLPPHVALMEIALQPCGFLSAYLRSPMLLPEADLYFRNLDGQARILAELDLRGKTLVNHVRMISSTRAQGVILQSFTFALSCEGTRFYEGDASFGFFPREAMLRQSGAETPADGTGMRHSPIRPAHLQTVPLVEPVPHQLQLLHRIHAEPEGGRYGKGLIRGEGYVTPWDWFFRAHFYEDPVMPGSLGVEAAAQALRAFGRYRHTEFARAIGAPSAARVQEWKYRGQIAPPASPPHSAGTPGRGGWSVEVHVAEESFSDRGRGVPAGSLALSGDAEVWRGSGAHNRVRIYEISGLSVRLDKDGEV